MTYAKLEVLKFMKKPVSYQIDNILINFFKKSHRKGKLSTLKLSDIQLKTLLDPPLYYINILTRIKSWKLFVILLNIVQTFQERYFQKSINKKQKHHLSSSLYY